MIREKENSLDLSSDDFHGEKKIHKKRVFKDLRKAQKEDFKPWKNPKLRF